MALRTTCTPQAHACALGFLTLALIMPCAGFMASQPALSAQNGVRSVVCSAVGQSPGMQCRVAAFASQSSVVDRPVISSEVTQSHGLGGAGKHDDKFDQEQKEFELNRGAAVDTLLSDYPTIFSKGCDFSIFHKQITLKDSQGFALEGLRSYKAFFSIITTLINVCFSSSENSVILMDKYGLDKNRIKIRWRFDLVPRLSGSPSDIFRWLDSNGDGVISTDELFASQSRVVRQKSRVVKEPVVVEGISVYKLDSKGQIVEHDIEITVPSNPAPLAILRELLPVRAAPTRVATIPNIIAIEPENDLSPVPQMGGQAVLPATSMQMAESSPGGTQNGGMAAGLFNAIGGKKLAKKLPQQCKTDYDCNPGGYNYPLQCMDFILGKFCVDPDDWNGGLGALAWGPEDLAADPIPVRVDDGYR